MLKKLFSPRLVKKHPDARRAISRGMRRTVPYVAMTKQERNKADGCFSTACYIKSVSRGYTTGQMR